MTVPYEAKVPGTYDVEVYADGEIAVTISGGYHGDDVERTFEIDEMTVIVAFAKRHKEAYQAWVDSGYEDESAYFKIMEAE